MFIANTQKRVPAGHWVINNDLQASAYPSRVRHAGLVGVVERMRWDHIESGTEALPVYNWTRIVNAVEGAYANNVQVLIFIEWRTFYDVQASPAWVVNDARGGSYRTGGGTLQAPAGWASALHKDWVADAYRKVFTKMRQECVDSNGNPIMDCPAFAGFVLQESILGFDEDNATTGYSNTLWEAELTQIMQHISGGFNVSGNTDCRIFWTSNFIEGNTPAGLNNIIETLQVTHPGYVIMHSPDILPGKDALINHNRIYGVFNNQRLREVGQEISINAQYDDHHYQGAHRGKMGYRAPLGNVVPSDRTPATDSVTGSWPVEWPEGDCWPVEETFFYAQERLGVKYYMHNYKDYINTVSPQDFATHDVAVIKAFPRFTEFKNEIDRTAEKDWSSALWNTDAVGIGSTTESTSLDGTLHAQAQSSGTYHGGSFEITESGTDQHKLVYTVANNQVKPGKVYAFSVQIKPGTGQRFALNVGWPDDTYAGSRFRFDSGVALTKAGSDFFPRIYELHNGYYECVMFHTMPSGSSDVQLRVQFLQNTDPLEDTLEFSPRAGVVATLGEVRFWEASRAPETALVIDAPVSGDGNTAVISGGATTDLTVLVGGVPTALTTIN